jgi:DNA-binding NarL/FixJ family response regulator
LFRGAHPKYPKDKRPALPGRQGEARRLEIRRTHRANKIRVLLADDEPMVRRGLRMRLELEPDVEVVGEAEDGSQALAEAKTLRPDAVLMDVRMPVMDGAEATAALRRALPGCAVVVLSIYDDDATRTRVRSAGAAAFVPKHRAEEALLAALRGVTAARK